MQLNLDDQMSEASPGPVFAELAEPKRVVTFDVADTLLKALDVDAPIEGLEVPKGVVEHVALPRAAECGSSGTEVGLRPAAAAPTPDTLLPACSQRAARDRHAECKQRITLMEQQHDTAFLGKADSLLTKSSWPIRFHL